MSIIPTPQNQYQTSSYFQSEDYNYYSRETTYRAPEVSVYSSWWRPRTDILEESNHVRVEFELPGIKSEDISLTATDFSLTLQSIKNQTNKESKGTYFLRERHFGNFYRRVTLPDYVDVSKRDAVLEDGVLKVVMPIKSPSDIEKRATTPITFHPHRK